MTDQEAARAELAELLPGGIDHWPRQQVDALLAHPDLVRRALGMGRKLMGAETAGRGLWVWVEPPTDQGENDG